MDENRTTEAARNFDSKAQELLGRGASTEAGSSFERALRNTVEQQPYTAAAIAFGAGWLLGRSNRPL
jgi:hypothetical protein